MSVDVNASHGHGIAHGVYHARTYLATPSVYMLIAGDKNAGLVLLLWKEPLLQASWRSLHKLRKVMELSWWFSLVDIWQPWASTSP